MDLIYEIDQFLLSGESRKREAHYLSDISACSRQLYYKWTEEPETNPVTAGGYWKMRMGDAIHDLVHEFLKARGLDIIPEVSGRMEFPALEYPISYRIDNLFVDEDGEVSGIEVKTTYGAGVRALKDEPKKRDIMQVSGYQNCANIGRFYLVYLGRDDGSRKQFIIEKDGSSLHISGLERRTIVDPFPANLDKLRELERAVRSRERPLREYVVAIKNGEIREKFQKDKVEYKSDWQCMYCRWRDECWAETRELFKDRDNAEMVALHRKEVDHDVA
jgi:hypothetical protein